MDENVLIQSAQKGDLHAFNKLVLAYQDLVYRQAFYILGLQEPAEDAAQAALLLAYRKLATFRGGSFRAWLLRIITHVCYDELRRWKRHPTLPLVPAAAEDQGIEDPCWLYDTGPSPEQAYEQVELRAAIRRGLEQLTPDYRAALVLVDLQGLEYAEAAAVLGIPIGTLKSRLARARLRLGVYLRTLPELLPARAYGGRPGAVSPPLDQPTFQARCIPTNRTQPSN